MESTQRNYMQLQKHKTHKVGDNQYYKYVIVVKEKLIKTLGWKEGDELEAEVKKDKLVIGKNQ